LFGLIGLLRIADSYTQSLKTIWKKTSNELYLMVELFFKSINMRKLIFGKTYICFNPINIASLKKLKKYSPLTFGLVLFEKLTGK